MPHTGYKRQLIEMQQRVLIESVCTYCGERLVGTVIDEHMSAPDAEKLNIRTLELRHTEKCPMRAAS